MVARFLALLELYREGLVAFDQVQALGELTVRWTGAGTASTAELDIDEYGDEDEDDSGERGDPSERGQTAGRWRTRRRPGYPPGPAGATVPRSSHRATGPTTSPQRRRPQQQPTPT